MITNITALPNQNRPPSTGKTAFHLRVQQARLLFTSMPAAGSSFFLFPLFLLPFALIFPILLHLPPVSLFRIFPFLVRPELMLFPVGVPSFPVMPVPRIPVVADPFEGMPAQLQGEGVVAGHDPGTPVVRACIPYVAVEEIVRVADKEDVLGDADGHVEPELGRLDEEGRLLDDDGGLVVGGPGHDDYGPGADIDPDIDVDVGGKGVG